MAALEGLALQEGDPRARRACAHPLAALCYAVRRGGGLGASGGAGGGGGDAASKGLQQLPADGALRPLLESLLEGRWALAAGGTAGAGCALQACLLLVPSSAADSLHTAAFLGAEGEEAAPQQQAALEPAAAAAILRCLAAAERLPAMNYGTLCRRLQRTSGADAGVQAAVVGFAAAQGSRQQQQYHLADFAADLLAEPALAAAPRPAQQQALEQLPQLLAGLPEAQAASALDSVCRGVCSTAAGGDSTRLAHLLLLLQSAAQLVESGAPALQLAAQQAVAEVLLPALPTPGRYPLQLHLLLRLAADPAELLSPGQRCWAAALRCLQLLPQQQLEALLQNAQLLRQLPLHAAAATAALAAAGAVDARALQHPRNLLLAGSGLRPRQQRAVASLVGAALAALPAERQQQWLLEVLDACKVRRGLRVCHASCWAWKRRWLAAASPLALTNQLCLLAPHPPCCRRWRIPLRRSSWLLPLPLAPQPRPFALPSWRRSMCWALALRGRRCRACRARCPCCWTAQRGSAAAAVQHCCCSGWGLRWRKAARRRTAILAASACWQRGCGCPRTCGRSSPLCCEGVCCKSLQVLRCARKGIAEIIHGRAAVGEIAGPGEGGESSGGESDS